MITLNMFKLLLLLKVIIIVTNNNMSKNFLVSTISDTRAGSYFTQEISLAIQSANAASVLGTNTLFQRTSFFYNL